MGAAAVDRTGLVPVICFHSWLPIDKETNVEKCRHCGEAYEHIDSWKRGAPGKGRAMEVQRKKVQSGDPKLANPHRPPECGDGDGHPEPIAWVLREKAIEWGVLYEKREKAVVITVPAPAETKAAKDFTDRPEDFTPSAPDDTKPVEPLTKSAEIVTENRPGSVITNVGKEVLESARKMPHANAKGLNRHEKHNFIVEFKDNIIEDAGKLGRTEAADLWGISVSAIDALRVVTPNAPRKNPKKGKVKGRPGPKPGTKRPPKPEPPAEAPQLSMVTLPREQWDCLKQKAERPRFDKAVTLGRGGNISIQINGNILDLTPADRTFVLDILQRMESYNTVQEPGKEK